MDDYSDNSFQIPATSSSNLLLADETSDFLAGTDITLATPTVTKTRRRSKTPAFPDSTPGASSKSFTRMPVRRSPRKHRGTPAAAAQLEEIDEHELSSALDNTLSPLKRQDRSFQIPSMTSVGMNLLLADDSGEMFRDASFGDSPRAAVPAHEAPAAHHATPPPTASPHTTIRTLSPRTRAEEDEAPPEGATPANSGSDTAAADDAKQPGASAVLHLADAVEAPHDAERSGLRAASPSVPFPAPAEARARSLAPSDARPDTPDGGVAPGEAFAKAAAAGPPAPAAVLPRRPARRASSMEVQTQSAAVSGGGMLKPAQRRSRASSIAPQTQKAKTTMRRRTRALSVVMQDVPTAAPGPSPTTEPFQSSPVTEPFQSRSTPEPIQPHASRVSETEISPAPADAMAVDSGLPGDLLTHENAVAPGQQRENPAGEAAAAQARAPTPDEAGDPNHAPPQKESTPGFDDAPLDLPDPVPEVAPVEDVAMADADEPPRAPAPAPLRRGTKRAAIADDDAPAPRKRARTVTHQRAGTRAGASTAAAKRSVRVLRSSRLKNASARGGSSGAAAGGQVTAATRGAGRSGDAARDAEAGKGSSGLAGSTGVARVRKVPIVERQQHLPPAKTTQPREFHFHLPARLDPRPDAPPAPALGPDFKTLHVAHAHSLAARRPAVAPTIPHAPSLNTEARAAERAQFDAARREREAEAERIREEERRIREEEEAREVKELRRRAVPKANEVPAWYANAPRRAARD